jgi:hypothetical protein
MGGRGCPFVSKCVELPSEQGSCIMLPISEALLLSVYSSLLAQLLLVYENHRSEALMFRLRLEWLYHENTKDGC